MLQLFKISPIKTGTTKYTSEEMVAKFVETINSNSSVFTAEINSSNKNTMNITSEKVNMESVGFSGSVIPSDAGYTIAIDDDKEFLLIIIGIIQNTCGSPSAIKNGFNYSSNDSIRSYDSIMCVTGKDINGNCFNLPISSTTNFTRGLSVIFDVGQRGTDSYAETGDYYLRQGAIYNYIVPEIFISMNRLGHTGQIIEKDGNQYVCLGGMIFYKI